MKKNWKTPLIVALTALLPLGAAFSEESPSGSSSSLKPQAQASIPLPINRISKHMADTRAFLQELSQNNSDVLMEYDNLSKLLKNAYLDNKTINEGDVHIILEAVGFAAESHKSQVRKGEKQTPYIIHPISVAEHLMAIGNIYNRDILVAALLHDTVEDTNTSFKDISKSFGAGVESYVKEVTDDKSLPKEERKKLQIANASKKSPGAAEIKLADKYDNLKSMDSSPPKDWDQKRIDDYFSWAQEVVNQLPAVNKELKTAIDQVIVQHSKSE